MFRKVKQGLHVTDSELGMQATDKSAGGCVTVGFMAYGHVPKNTVYGIEANESAHKSDIKYGIQATNTVTEGCVTVGFMAFENVPKNRDYGIEDYRSAIKHPSDEELVNLSHTVRSSD